MGELREVPLRDGPGGPVVGTAAVRIDRDGDLVLTAVVTDRDVAARLVPASELSFDMHASRESD